MLYRLIFCLVFFFLFACSSEIGFWDIFEKRSVVIKTSYPEIEIERKELSFNNITVLIKEIYDVRQRYHIGSYLPMVLAKESLYDYIADEDVSDIVTKKLINVFKASGFNVLGKHSVKQKYDLEVTGKVLNYFVTVKGSMAGNSTKAEVSLKIKIYAPSDNCVIFDDIIVYTISHDSIKPAIINDSADMAVAKVVENEAFINALSLWMNQRNKEPVPSPHAPFTTVAQTQKLTEPERSGDAYRSKIGLQWAVVIGISRYKYAGENLPNIRFADKDAEAFYSFLISEHGGKFSKVNTRLLLNEDATYKNMREALFDFLKKAIEEDIVYIYFSGHGSPEPDNRDNLYLLPYDTDPARIASTAFPMRDVEAALAHHIKARRVLVFADACHSGGVGGDFGTKGIVVQGNTINKYLKALSESRIGRVIITASEAHELSREGEKWGGGHGVFTYYLLQGLKGEADTNQDQIVTLGEVLIYTDERVRRDTNSGQHPVVSGKIDMNMPLAIVNY